MKFFLVTLFFLVGLAGCAHLTPLEEAAQHYRLHGDFTALNNTVELMPAGMDTATVRRLLGEPIDMGFDLRYLVDSIGPTGCAIGAVFHIDEAGLVDDKWTGDICE